MKIISFLVLFILSLSTLAQDYCHEENIQIPYSKNEEAQAYNYEVGIQQIDLENMENQIEDAMENTEESTVDLEGMSKDQNNVILISMDGIRSYEFYRGTSWLLNRTDFKGNIFPYIWNEMIPNGNLFGRKGIKSTFRSADKLGISLPNYQAIFLGHNHGFLLGNANPRVKQETMFERIKRELNLSFKQVAAIGSWSGVNRAVAKDPESYFINIGQVPLNDGTNDPVIKQLNEEQKKAPGWNRKNTTDRDDKYTWMQAMHYLKKHKPRLMYINLLDADEYAHNMDYTNYLKSLRWFDNKIKELMTLLKNELKDYGKNTTVLITTDHSRGFAWLWSGHSIEKNIFLVAKGPYTKKVGRVKGIGVRNHYSIRPTIEMLFGLKPATPAPPLYSVLKNSF